MKKSIKIRDSLYLNIDSFKIDKNNEKKESSKNFYMILDVSYSMSWVLNQLKEDLKNKLRNIMKDGDTLTLARFSSENWEYEYFTVWFRKALDSDFNLFDKKLDEKVKPLWSTCFSEVLNDLPSIVKQVNDTYQWDNIVCFLTDGEPCVSNYQKELENIFKNLEKIEVDSFVFVWYTSYYNRELLSEMTEKVQGNFIHAQEFKDYSFETNKVFENFSNKYVIIEVNKSESSKNLVHFTIDEDIVLNQKVEWNNVKMFVNKEKDEVNLAYFSNKNDFEVIHKNDLNDLLIQYLYASVLQLSKNWKRLDALEILSYLWDKYLLDIYDNSLTTIELAYFDKEVEKAVFDVDSRFIEWKEMNYLPNPNKFCIVELFDLLKERKAKFYLNWLESYNKTTAEYKKLEDNLSKFIKNDEAHYFDINWNQEELNLSIKCKINWYVDLSNVEEDISKLNIPEKYYSFIFRNYSIISDWKLNIEKLPIQIDEDTFNELKKKNVISKKEEFNDKFIYIELTKLPIINKKISSKEYQFSDIANKQFKLEEIKAKLKVINSLLPTKKDEFSWKAKFVLSQEASEFLSKIWITSYWYSPKVERVKLDEEWKDYRIARTVRISVKWFSSLPKVDVIKDKNDSKSLPIKIMFEFYELIKNNNVEENRKIQESLEKEKDQLIKEIREICFSIILWRTMFKTDSQFSEEIETEYWINSQVTFKFSKVNVRM